MQASVLSSQVIILQILKISISNCVWKPGFLKSVTNITIEGKKTLFLLILCILVVNWKLRVAVLFTVDYWQIFFIIVASHFNLN